MKTTICFSALEITILLLQAAAVGGIIVLISLTGANASRVLIGAATLTLILAKVAGGLRRGRLTENAARTEH